MTSGERFVFTPGKQDEFHAYRIGSTPLYACQADPRFSYCLYVPETYVDAQDVTWPLAVVVHGTNRPAQRYRDAFADFAEANTCIVMAPLFPAGITSPWELGSYKFLLADGLRYDHVLLSMVEEVSGAYNIAFERFLLHGFSGGGHFAHRFLYLHPERLMGCSIGAPGVVTLLDFSRDWWVGVRNVREVFGQDLDIEAVRSVAIQMVVGSADTAEWEITIGPESRLWMPDANLASGTRLDRLQMLRDSFERHGIAVRHDVVPDVMHEGFKLLEPVKEFFTQVLSERFPRSG